jgi:hypothetical protein
MSLRTFVCIAVSSASLIRARASHLADDPSRSLPWVSNAKLNGFPKSTPGSLKISADGIDFHFSKGDAPIHWALVDIRTVALSGPRKLSLVSYQNRRWHLPGDRPFDFTLKTPMPPEIAAELVRRVGKPAINGVPSPEGSNFAMIPARHKTATGGSSGTLRFSDSGIDYVSRSGDARSWRWADIETIAHPEPYRFRVGSYLETFDFELKRPLTTEMFDRLWDHVCAQQLNVEEREGDRHAESR